MAELNIGDGNALFGVFDGHGGGEVAQWVAKNFAKELKKNQKYK
jgi:serine/threonine protein phosphatase PrpC